LSDLKRVLHSCDGEEEDGDKNLFPTRYISQEFALIPESKQEFGAIQPRCVLGELRLHQTVHCGWQQPINSSCNHTRERLNSRVRILKTVLSPTRRKYGLMTNTAFPRMQITLAAPN